NGAEPSLRKCCQNRDIGSPCERRSLLSHCTGWSKSHSGTVRPEGHCGRQIRLGAGKGLCYTPHRNWILGDMVRTGDTTRLGRNAEVLSMTKVSQPVVLTLALAFLGSALFAQTGTQPATGTPPAAPAKAEEKAPARPTGVAATVNG